jgi:hypothetical protein
MGYLYPCGAQLLIRVLPTWKMKNISNGGRGVGCVVIIFHIDSWFLILDSFLNSTISGIKLISEQNQNFYLIIPSYICIYVRLSLVFKTVYMMIRNTINTTYQCSLEISWNKRILFYLFTFLFLLIMNLPPIKKLLAQNNLWRVVLTIKKRKYW